MRRFPLSLLVIAVALATFAPIGAQQNDVIISQRQQPVCDPQSATPYVFYNVTDGKWHCTATPPVVYNGSTLTSTAVEINKLHSVTAGIATASKFVLLDANKAVGGQFVALGGAATTSAGANVGALSNTTNATSGTTQSTEYTLNSIALPASAFNTTGQAIEVTAWGTTSANANAKNIKIYFGSTAVATVTGTTASGKDFLVTLRCIRTGASTQSCIGTITVDTGTSATFAIAAATETDTNAITIALKSANTAAAAASATGKGMLALFLNK